MHTHRERCKQAKRREQHTNWLPHTLSLSPSPSPLPSPQKLENLDISTLTPLSPEVISRQATINIGECCAVFLGCSCLLPALLGPPACMPVHGILRMVSGGEGKAQLQRRGLHNRKCKHRHTCTLSFSRKQQKPNTLKTQAPSAMWRTASPPW